VTELEKKLEAAWNDLTPSGKRIAIFCQNNMSSIPFETAVSLSKRVGVSPMTVSRFLRQLGYAGLGELKEELRTGSANPAWLDLYRVRETDDDTDWLQTRLDAEIKTLVGVYKLADSREWRSIVAGIVNAKQVSVASFQQGRFIGRGFVDLLQPAKPRTRFIDGSDGAYIDMLLDAGDRACVILIDFQRYSRHFRVLAEEVAARRLPLVIITDTYCYWARDLTDNALMMPPRFRSAWHNFGALMSLLGLLVESVIRESDDVYERITAISKLRQKFVGYVGLAPVRDDRERS
jgi:DNA-binding MurR/RpiR family transcriptional regulator